MAAKEHDLVRIGVIGLGFMGATHVGAYQSAAAAGLPCRLVAVCDRKASRRAGDLSDVGGNIATEGREKLAFDPKQVKAYERPEELLADPAVDLVSVCTRTDTHIAMATAALRAGKHVLVEKPVALDAGEIEQLAAEAERTGRVCMPAMCMRFWPGWTWLKQRIDDRSLGRLQSLTLQRLASMPAWSQHFFKDGAKSGGALFDLHIHDTDFVYWCFGMPQSVSSAGRIGPSGQIDHVMTVYRYNGLRDGLHRRTEGPDYVVAEGAWDHHPGFTFRVRFVAIFDDATVDYDLTRDPPLLLCRDGKAEPLSVEGASGYDLEIRHLIDRIAKGSGPAIATLADAAAVTRLLAAEQQSVGRGGEACRAG